MSTAIEISEILQRYLPPDGEGTERERLRMNLHREIGVLVSQKCEKQRGICAEEVECGDGESEEFKREIKALRELVLNVPEPGL